MLARQRGLELAAVSVLALAIGCKGCEDPANSPAAIAEPEPEGPSSEELRERLSRLNVDLAKTYPARTDGVVECGDDKTCFLVMLERCEAALLDHKEEELAGLLIKKVHARYRIEGKTGDSCALQRLVIEADVELPEQTRKSLADKGRADLDISLMLGEAKLLLASHLLPRVTCVFSRNRALELGLDMVEKRAFDKHFEGPCDAVGEEDVWPQDLTPPSVAPQSAAEPEPAAR